MDHQKELLIAQLDLNTLRRLPCYIENQNLNQFRIGLIEGPQIKFYSETDDLYYLYLRDVDGKDIHMGISTESVYFTQIELIVNEIKDLVNEDAYVESLNNQSGFRVMITNLNNIVQPIIEELLS